MTATTHSPRPIPILVYHSICDDPPAWIAPYTVTPSTFRTHLDFVLANGLSPLTVSDLGDAIAGRRQLPAHPVVLTFDDGFADTLEVAAPAMAERSIPSTLYVTSGALQDLRPPAASRLGPARMLRAGDLVDLEALGVEIGSHTVTHPPLDVIPRKVADLEIRTSKRTLEELLGHAIRTFAYPHGFYNPRLTAAVGRAGYDTAVAVRNAFSSEADNKLALARLMVMADTPLPIVGDWLSGSGAQVAPFPVRLRTRVWRSYRRASEVARALQPDAGRAS